MPKKLLANYIKCNYFVRKEKIVKKNKDIPSFGDAKPLLIILRFCSNNELMECLCRMSDPAKVRSKS